MHACRPAAGAAAESQATSNAQMPPTAPLHIPQRPTSRSITQNPRATPTPSDRSPIPTLTPRLHPEGAGAHRVTQRSPAGVGTSAGAAAGGLAGDGKHAGAHGTLHGAWESMELQSQLKSASHGVAAPHDQNVCTAGRTSK